MTLNSWPFASQMLRITSTGRRVSFLNVPVSSSETWRQESLENKVEVGTKVGSRDENGPHLDRVGVDCAIH